MSRNLIRKSSALKLKTIVLLIFNKSDIRVYAVDEK